MADALFCLSSSALSSYAKKDAESVKRDSLRALAPRRGRLVAHLKALLKSSSTVSSSQESCQRWSPVVVDAAPMVRPTPAPGALDAPAVRCDRSVSASFQSISSEGISSEGKRAKV